MSSPYPTRTNDTATAHGNVNDAAPPDLGRALSDDEIATVVGGFSHVELPIIVEGSHGDKGKPFVGRHFDRRGR